MRVSRRLHPLRVLHCPWNIGGQAASLAAAEREIGLSSVSVAWEPSNFGFHADEIVFPSRRTSLPAREFARLSLLMRALQRTDVVHFNWGDTIFPTRPVGMVAREATGSLRQLMGIALAATWAPLRYADLRLLRWSGKILAVTFQGDDARQGDWQRRNFDNSVATVVGDEYYTPQSDAWKRRRIRKYDRYMHLIYALNPDLLHVLPARAKFLPYATVDPRHWLVCSTNNKVPVVVHAPSHRRAKGTEIVLAAAETLKARGVSFELRIVEGVNFERAREIYRTADLLIDQLHAGFYGSLAVELMALGKPVLCYLRERDLQFLPKPMRSELPIVSVQPESLVDILEEFFGAGRHLLAELGVRSRSFVERWHDPVRIARTVAQDYENAYEAARDARRYPSSA